MKKEKTPHFSFTELESILIEFSISIHEKNTEEELVWDLAKNCISKLALVDCVIYFVDHEKRILVQKAAHGPKNPREHEIYAPINIPLGKGITGTVALNGIGEIIEDTSKDSRYIQDDDLRYSEITIPIKINNQVIGIIDCEHHEKGFFTDQYFRVLSAISSIFAIKLDSIRKDKLNKEKEEQLLAVQREMLTLKAKALRSQMNPHFVFNSLNAIQHFVTINDKKNTLKYISIFSKLIRYYLTNFESEVIFLEEEVKMLERYLLLQHLRYEDRFTYTFNSSSIEMMGSIKIPSLILPLLIENAVENAVNNSTKVEELLVNLESKEDAIEILVTYNTTTKGSKESHYREKITPWEEQLELLNKLKHYQIKKKVTINEQGDKSIITIQLTVPILD